MTMDERQRRRAKIARLTRQGATAGEREAAKAALDRLDAGDEAAAGWVLDWDATATIEVLGRRYVLGTRLTRTCAGVVRTASDEIVPCLKPFTYTRDGHRPPKYHSLACEQRTKAVRKWLQRRRAGALQRKPASLTHEGKSQVAAVIHKAANPDLDRVTTEPMATEPWWWVKAEPVPTDSTQIAATQKRIPLREDGTVEHAGVRWSPDAWVYGNDVVTPDGGSGNPSLDVEATDATLYRRGAKWPPDPDVDDGSLNAEIAYVESSVGVAAIVRNELERLGYHRRTREERLADQKAASNYRYRYGDAQPEVIDAILVHAIAAIEGGARVLRRHSDEQKGRPARQIEEKR